MRYSFVFLILCCAACSQHPEEQIPFLNGYWEIEQVTFPDGTVKHYSLNTTMDYLEVTDLNGVRKKVVPQLDGTFTTFKQTEQFGLLVDGDSLRLKYEMPFDAWTETVIKANEELLIVKNKDNKVYRYKRFEPITISQ